MRRQTAIVLKYKKKGLYGCCKFFLRDFDFFFYFYQENVPSDDIQQEKARLRQINKDFQAKEQEYDSLYEEHSKTQLDLQLKHQALDAFKETIAVFDEQMDLHRRFHGEASNHHDIQR